MQREGESLNESSPSNPSPQSSVNPAGENEKILQESEGKEDTRELGHLNQLSKQPRSSQRQKEQAQTYRGLPQTLCRYMTVNMELLMV